MPRPLQQAFEAELVPESQNPAQTNGVSWAFPEGGQQAWTCLLGSCLLVFPSFGFQTAIGLSKTTSAQTSSPVIVSATWAGSPSFWCSYFVPQSQVGPLSDRYGPRTLLVCGRFYHFFPECFFLAMAGRRLSA
ncbi:hypothetical protein BDW75DRAFT_242040 [Aspergillus navahoensis]